MATTPGAARTVGAPPLPSGDATIAPRPPAPCCSSRSAFAVSWVRLPYYSFGAGPAREIAPLIHVEDAPTYGSVGHLVMTTVRFDKLTALGMLVAWIDPDRSVVGEDVVYPPGLTVGGGDPAGDLPDGPEQDRCGRGRPPRLTDYPKEHGAGALVESVGPDARPTVSCSPAT